jgi:hypothetical protein
MFATCLFISFMTCGIDVGWKVDTDGEVVYLIQIEPESLESLKSGSPFQSYVQSDVQISQFQITVGTAELPRETLPKKAAPVDEKPPGGEGSDSTEKSPPDSSGSKPFYFPFLIASAAGLLFLAALLYLGWLHIGIRARFRKQLVDPGAGGIGYGPARLGATPETAKKGAGSESNEPAEEPAEEADDDEYEYVDEDEEYEEEDD